MQIKKTEYIVVAITLVAFDETGILGVTFLYNHLLLNLE